MIPWLSLAALAQDEQATVVVEEEAPAGPDRSVRPAVVPPEPLELPEPEVHALGPGARVWYVRVPAVRKVVVDVAVQRGLVDLVGGATQTGRAAGWMADAAAGDLDAAALSIEKDLHEIDLWSDIGLHDGWVSLVAPAEEVGRGLELQGLVLSAPGFPKKDLERYLRDQELFYLVEAPSSQRRVAESALGFAWFPADHPYGARPDLSELKRVKPAGLAELWRRWTTSGPATAIVVGDVPFSELKAPLEQALAGLGADVPRSPDLDVPVLPGTRVFAVDMPGQEQVAVRLRASGPADGDAERVPMTAASWVLGGHFLSRLNLVLREERGYTYGSSASYDSGPTWGNVTVRVDVGVENLAETIEVIEAEVQRLVDEGATLEEIESARRSYVQDWNLTFQDARRAAALYRQALEDGATIAELRQRRLALADVAPEDVRRVAGAWLGADQPRLWVLVGDRAKMEPELAQAGLEPVWLDPRQASLGNFEPGPARAREGE